jgi:hypothetical protein
MIGLHRTPLQVTLAGPRKKSLDELARAGDPEATFLIPPQAYIDAIRQLIGPDLDICSTPRAQLHIGAQSWFNVTDAAASLAQPWFGRLYAPLHPNRKVARAQLTKLLKDYLSERVESAVLLLRGLDYHALEPILLSFPLALHYKRMAHSRWNAELSCYERHWPSFNSVTAYLPARAGAVIDERQLERFSSLFRSFGRPLLPECLVPDWEVDATLATAGARPQPLLLRRSPIRVPTP